MHSARGGSLAVAAVAVCLAVLAMVGTCVFDSQEIGGSSFTFAGWSSASKEESYQSCTLTEKAFRIQGAASSLSDDATLPGGILRFSTLRVSNGYIVVEKYFPRNTNITIKDASGTVAAGMPFIDANTAIFSDQLSIVVTDSTLSWAAARSGQSMVRAPFTIQLSSSLFVLGSTVAQASSVVEVTGPSSISQKSALAVDYAKCTGCAQGLVYFTDFVRVWDRSLLRVSHSSVKGAAGKPLIGIAQRAGASLAVENSLFVVENVSSPTSNLIDAPVSMGTDAQITLRAVAVKSIGATMAGGVTAQLLTADDIAQQIPSVSVVPDTSCAAACVPTATVDSRCKCTCNADMPNMNFCTAMKDPYTNYAYLGCSVGCTTCFNETACLECRPSYEMLPSMTCSLTGLQCTDPNCKTCTTYGQCTDCNDGYGLTSSSACVRCSVAGCKSCPVDANVCEVCLGGSEPVNNMCPCTDANCASCPSDAGTCTQCANGYGLVDGACVRCQVPNCFSCDSDANKCAQCAPNYYLTPLLTCSPVACNIEHCMQCDPQTPSRCQECVAPYVVDSYDGLCRLSDACSVPNCKKCETETSRLCAECDTGYTLTADATSCSSPTTQPCDVEHCNTCVNGDSTRCAYCNTGYYVSDGKCKTMQGCYVSNCAQCMLLDSTKCSTCMKGYLLTSSYGCVSQKVINGVAAPYSLWVAAAVLLASVVTHIA
ncbi:surface antigen-like protein [Leishmania infantum JPCM5]|uniref:Surface_antigen-like_protein n=2 Tax=Leishmania infantum TaxID=5671 RepID=A0A6L0WHA9_LEIIN|nr:surface antigen-like protein [Leishmania infantum JPCM5]CAC9440654.1 surface_antigen-like_protein [Leishmania infantum]CAM65042.1 surface antigen-like protein [Leishmania infantum JPCM5]SUZ38815.1 surface_antigen-like_protein [Leishmania infantum]|eukprot:XP_001462856.1 surface antigen-like protein [Leishmania infantum JPCM5]